MAIERNLDYKLHSSTWMKVHQPKGYHKLT
jgi:hypothetical protein